jgi:hypothetical protein
VASKALKDTEYTGAVRVPAYDTEALVEYQEFINSTDTDEHDELFAALWHARRVRDAETWRRNENG